jgi:hypothetical protein
MKLINFCRCISKFNNGHYTITKLNKTIYVSRNIEQPSPNCCCGKGISVKYSECAYVFLYYVSSMKIATAVIILTSVGCSALTCFFHIIS